MCEAKQLRYQYRGEVSETFGRLSYRNGNIDKYLRPCQRVTDPDVLVGIIAYNQMQAMRFIPRHKDRQPIRITIQQTGQELQLPYPGKSAFLYFDESPTKKIVGELVHSSLDRMRERTDHLHLSTVGWIEEAGWQTWWAPLPERDNWLHARLVPNSIIEKGTTPTLEDAEALLKTFIKAI